MLTFKEYQILISDFAFHITKEEYEIMTEMVDLNKGGCAVVMVGNTGLVQEYTNHPQIKFIKCKEEPVLETSVPDNTKIAIITEGIGNYYYQWIMSYCRRKNIPWVVRKSNQAVYDTLKLCLPSKSEVTLVEVKETQNHGKLNVLIELIDYNKSNAENAKNLLKICFERGIKTTEASLAQFVGNNRRKLSQPAVIKSARPKLDLSVELLDEMIKQLTDMREFLISTCEENRLLKIKVDKFKKAMEE